ncbi:MAG TPA: hypothetical protein VEA69_23625 [Tepidisphaeraceae bacterium]|nr:hypothetical protein [Tepidisphaeraceae bacterium]
MTERDYFLRLEGRVSRELAGMRRRELQHLWCDGFIPEAFDVVGERCRVTGRVWLTFGDGRQECWNFVVYVGAARPREAVDWAVLVPAEDVTGWLSLDFETRFLKVDPLAAHADRELS